MPHARLAATAAAVLLFCVLAVAPAFAQAALPYKAYGTSLKPGQVVEAFDGSVSVGKTSVDADGNWVLDIQPGAAAANDVISFTLDGQPTATTVVFASGQFTPPPGLTLVAGSASSITPLASSSGTTGTYTIKAGDTLYDLGIAWGTTADAIASANNITDPSGLQIGQVLKMPGSSPASTSASGAPATGASSGGSYTVQAGDTLYGLAIAWGTTADAIASANKITDPTLLQIGQVLKRP